MPSNKDKPASGKQLSNFRRMMGYVTGFWQFRAVIALILFSTFLDVQMPMMIGDVIDLISNISAGKALAEWDGGLMGVLLLPISQWIAVTYGYDPNYSALGTFIITIVAIAGGVALLNYAIRYGGAWISQRGTYGLRSDMYNSLLEQSFSFYDKQRTGQLMARATGDIDQIDRWYDIGLRMSISTVILLAMVLWNLWNTDASLTLITLLVLPLLFVTMLTFGRKTFPVTQKMRQQYGEITSVFQENLMGLRVVRGFAQEAQEEEKIERELTKYFDQHVLTAKYRAFFLPLATLITSGGFVMILLYGGNQVIAGAMSIGSLIAFYLYLTRIAQPVRMLGNISNLVLRANAAAGRVFETIDAQIAVHDKPDAVEITRLQGHVQFQHVDFGYDENNLVLRGVNLDVKPGMTVAILGATGSGKSSIINLIPRFYDVTAGAIKIDERDVRDYQIRSLREHIGIVRQDPFIFSTTFRENIAYGVDDAKTEDIEAAAKRAKIHDHIASTPKGYNTEVGERGVTISGGQKQRIAIARALLKNPKILILDDSTSSVDTQTEHDIQQALDELLTDRTTFIITQRLSSIKKADYIVVLDDGVVAEEGTHDHLMTLNGIYRKLYETQVSGAEQKEAD
ncbi:TPA: ABC transporter ATP-binding protein [Candidatus Bathyarchaeota archaeon]|nr:ABC transporter ATP-binding protein [Candidatus Bathyarchaeota archaeon]